MFYFKIHQVFRQHPNPIHMTPIKVFLAKLYLFSKHSRVGIPIPICDDISNLAYMFRYLYIGPDNAHRCSYM